MRSFSKLRKDFLGDRRGSFAVAGALAAPVLALAIGYSVDVAQLVHTRSNLQNALDAAVTSTARDLTTGKIKEKDARKSVEAFFRSNVNTMLAQDDNVVLSSLVVNRVTKTVDAQAHVDAKMFFPVFGLSDQRRVGVNSSALYSDRKIEVVMMLDITGSMNEKNKIGDLRKAADNAVDGLLNGNDPDDPRVRLSIVPYAAAVNVGAMANDDTVFPEVDPQIVNRYVRNINPNLPLPLLTNVSGLPGLRELISDRRKDACATERRMPNGDADVSDDGPQAIRRNVAQRYDYLALVNRDDRLDESDCPTPAVVPLTADAAKLKLTISKFRADGTTAGAIALQWGAYMLSPEWRDTIRAARLGSGPAAYDNKKTAKVAILMTDGLFNTAYSVDDTVQGRQLSRQYAKSRENAEGICEAMKDNGIEVYTVGFALPPGESGDARKLLAGCASPDNSIARQHFFDAASGEELDDAFQEIIANAERLAVTR